MAKEYSYGICPYLIISGNYFVLLNKTGRTSYYNFFKGKKENNETKEQTAIREFYEETGIKVAQEDLCDYFFQKNKRKDIGIFLLDFSKYNNVPFNFQEKEIFSATWVNISKFIETSKNQKEIFKDIMEYFKPLTKNLKSEYVIGENNER